jgi:hypothetical protein
VIEKVVDRPIDQIVLIPRSGIRFPVYINSLIGRGSRSLGADPKGDDPANANSNVMPLKKVN